MDHAPGIDAKQLRLALELHAGVHIALRHDGAGKWSCWANEDREDERGSYVRTIAGGGGATPLAALMDLGRNLWPRQMHKLDAALDYAANPPAPAIYRAPRVVAEEAA